MGLRTKRVKLDFFLKKHIPKDYGSYKRKSKKKWVELEVKNKEITFVNITSKT